MVIYSLVAVIGATMNFIAVFLLSGTVVQLVKDYFNDEGKKKVN